MVLIFATRCRGMKADGWWYTSRTRRCGRRSSSMSCGGRTRSSRINLSRSPNLDITPRPKHSVCPSGTRMDLKTGEDAWESCWWVFRQFAVLRDWRTGGVVCCGYVAEVCEA